MAGYVVVDNLERNKIRRRNKRRTILASIVAVTNVVLLLCQSYWSTMMKRFAILACDDARSTITLAMHKVVVDVLANADFGKFVSVLRDDDGDIVAVEANRTAVNSFALQTSLSVQNAIADNTTYGVPIGTVSGFTLLSEVGPTVQATFRQIGVAECDLQSEFTSAGINQTLHRLYAVVVAQVEVVLPSVKQALDVQTSVLICETLIVGKVPQVYVGK